MDTLSSTVSRLWERRKELAPGDPDALATVNESIGLLDRGEARVAEIDPASDEVVVHEWLRQAILLLFLLSEVRLTEHGPFEYTDKLELKHGLQAAGVRAVPGASVRRGAFLARGVVLMPSYVNIGAYVGPETMVDTWVTVGSCAQIGARVHLSGGGRDRRSPRTTECSSGRDRGRSAHRQPVDGHPRSPRRRGVRARGRHDPQPVDPGDRRLVGRGARAGLRAALERRGRRHAPQAVPGRRVLPALCAGRAPSDPWRAPRQGAVERHSSRTRGIGVSPADSGLLELTAELVDIPSVSHDEARAAAFVTSSLRGSDHLETRRIGHNVVSRTLLGRPHRVILAGHLDTVPPNGNERAVLEGERCWGLAPPT